MDASYPPPQSYQPPQPPPQEKKSRTWLIVAGIAVLLVGGYFTARALRPKSLAQIDLHRQELPGLSLELPDGTVVGHDTTRESGSFVMRQLGLKSTVVSVHWEQDDGLDGDKARSISQMTLDTFNKDDGALKGTREREVNGHHAWIDMGHSGVLAVVSMTWYCEQDHRIINVFIATSASMDQGNQLADRVADSVRCHLADDSGEETP